MSTTKNKSIQQNQKDTQNHQQKQQQQQTRQLGSKKASKAPVVHSHDQEQPETRMYR